MSGSREQSLFFISLPDQRKLCSVSLSFQASPEDCRNQQMKTCRDLVLLYSNILASPSLNSFTDIWLIMAMPFYQTGVIQAYGHRHSLQLGTPQSVLPGVLQCCVSYSLTTRLAPSWNRAGPYLLSGKEFMTERGRLNAVRMEFNTSANQLCVSVEANTVRLPPTEMEDFGFPPMVLKSFSAQMDGVLHTSSMGASSWCYVLPSMKRGRIMSISRHLPADSPFKSYQDLRKHWLSLYGYSLPEQTVEQQIYCSVYFKLVGERLFTYPLSCIRMQPVLCCPRADLQGALSSFTSDLRDRLQSVCGLPVRMTSKPCYHTSSLTSSGSAQVLDGKPVNLTTQSSIRPVLTQLPTPVPPPVQPPFGPRLPGKPQLSLRPGGVSLGKERHEGGTPASSQSSSCSARRCPSSTLPGPSPMAVPFKLVPIFKNRVLARHINVTQLLARKQQNQRKGGAEEAGRVTLANYTTKRAAPPSPSNSCLVSSSPSSSSSSSSLPPSLLVWSQRPRDPAVPPPLPVPHLTHRPKAGVVNTLPPSHDLHPKANHNAAAPVTSDPRPKASPSASQRGGVQSRCEAQPPYSVQNPPAPAFDIPSNKGGERFVSRPRRPRQNIQEADVEGMARSKQLFKVNSATLLAWLRGRGVSVHVKDRKEELMLRVMACLAET